MRGTVPDQVDDELARAVGNAFVQVTGRRRRWSSATTCGRRAPAWPPPSPRAPPAAGADVTLIGLASTDQLYFASRPPRRPRARCSPRATTPRSTTASSSAVPTRPRSAADTGLTAGPRPRRRRRPTERAEQPGAITTVDVLAGVRRPPPRPGAGDRPAAQGRRRRRQRHGRAHRARGPRPARPRRRPALLRARRHLPEPRGEPDRAGEPRATCRPRSSQHGADLGLAFDGDADRCFVVDERGEPVSPSVLTALIAARELAKEPGATVIHNLITSRAVPEIVTERGGVAGAHPRRPLLHQGDDGRDRRGLRRRALRPLLLPRLLARRLRHARGAAHAGRARRARTRPLQRPARRVLPGSPPAARSTRRSTTRRRSMRRVEQAYADEPGVEVDHLDGLTVVHTPTGGSMSGPRTPSRCSGSTPRAPTSRR